MATDGIRSYREVISSIEGKGNDTLDEGSGVITNTLAVKLMRDISALEKKVVNSKRLEDKVDNLAKQNTKLASLDAIAIAVSGKAKGKFDKGSRLISMIRALK